MQKLTECRLTSLNSSFCFCVNGPLRLVLWFKYSMTQASHLKREFYSEDHTHTHMSCTHEKIMNEWELFHLFSNYFLEMRFFVFWSKTRSSYLWWWWHSIKSHCLTILKPCLTWIYPYFMLCFFFFFGLRHNLPSQITVGRCYMWK